MAANQDRTILVEIGNLRPFSDVAGRHVIRLDDSSQRRQELAQRLKAAGCPVNLDGTDWHTVGDFDSVLKLLDKIPTSESSDETGQTSDNDATAHLSQDAEKLLSEVAKDCQALMRVAIVGQKLRISTTSKYFVCTSNPREVARWKAVLKEIEDLELAEVKPDRRGTNYILTDKGFRVADELAKQE